MGHEQKSAKTFDSYLILIACRYIGTDNNIARTKTQTQMKGVLSPSLINGSKNARSNTLILQLISTLLIVCFINLISRSIVETAVINIGKNVFPLFFYCPLRQLTSLFQKRSRERRWRERRRERS